MRVSGWRAKYTARTVNKLLPYAPWIWEAVWLGVGHGSARVWDSACTRARERTGGGHSADGVQGAYILGWICVRAADSRAVWVGVGHGSARVWDTGMGRTGALVKAPVADTARTVYKERTFLGGFAYAPRIRADLKSRKSAKAQKRKSAGWLFTANWCE